MRHYTAHCATGYKYSFYGPAWAIYVWALEKIPGLGAAVGVPVPGKEDAAPRILRWEFTPQVAITDDALTQLFETEV